MKKNILFFALLVGVFSSCKQQYEVVSMSGSRTEINSSFDPSNENKPNAIEAFVNHYKTKLDAEMNQVVGKSEQEMPYTKGESLLTNFTSDAMLKAGGKDADLAFMNVNGHRANLPKGDITLGNLYETYSFDNALVSVKVKGSVLNDVFKSYAKMGGAGISSTARLEIDKSGNLLSALVNGKPVDPNKIYTVITLDYLAEGNDGFEALKNAETITPLGILLRDLMIDYVKKQTAQGKPISSALDGRITIK